MKKVLLISYSFNQEEVIGSVRLRGLAKYLPDFGWEPLILTTGSGNSSTLNDQFRVIEVPHKTEDIRWKDFLRMDNNKTLKEQISINNSLKKENYADNLLKLWKEVFAFPDEKKNWFKPAVNDAGKFIEDERIDAIISSSMPLTSHLIGHRLKRKYNIPWIADLRDLWSQNHYLNFSKLRKYRDLKLERETLSYADALTTVTKLFKEQLSEIHDEKKIFVIPNGFDPDLVNPGESLTNKLSITYTGNLYMGKRDPSILFKALNELNLEQKIDLNLFELNFYGRKERWLNYVVEKYDLQDIVKLHGQISREHVIKKQRESQLLLLLSWNNPKEFSTVPGKVFEYLAARRPILSYGVPLGCIKELIEKTSSGSHLSNLSGIKSFVLDNYLEFTSKGKIEYTGNLDVINKYNHFNMAKKFAYILDKA